MLEVRRALLVCEGGEEVMVSARIGAGLVGCRGRASCGEWM